ncbi:MAG: hybrid sensor histidine kinase/response regulator [Anaerolineae bacterium]|nr:hybrid sensor histidine kinase/response regulator [Anaerolineae bacterium]MDW8170890.1 hybrid sensor histidine kinase/response regulator [Anaerolineae bacterium]
MEISHARVLIVDDNEENLQVLGDILAMRDYNVTLATSGRQAFELIDTSAPFDLILLDIQMPIMSGYDVCEQLKRNPLTREIPVIFISAHNEVEDIVRGFEVGGVDYITKPLQIREVLARVENHLVLARQRQALVEKNALIEALRQRDQETFDMLNAMKDQFIYAATHDLKNPLFIITAYLNLLRDLPQVKDHPDGRRYLDGIQDGVTKMQRLITAILDLAQIQTGANIRMTEVDLYALLEAVTQRFRVLAEQAHIDLLFDSLGQAPYRLLADANRLEQLFDNLISNAIKYTPPNGQVHVVLERLPETLLVEVRDSGFGIPEEALPHLFTAFYRVRTPRHGPINGTGLGLAIVKSLVDLHGGQIEVSSIVDQGTTFRVMLPAL